MVSYDRLRAGLAARRTFVANQSANTMNTPAATTWKIDAGHSALQFRVKHLGIANVVGTFGAFTGTVQTAHDDFADAQVRLEMEAASLSTNNAVRDSHLKSDLFFDVQRFPALTFSGSLQKAPDHYTLTGALTIRGVSKPITLRTAFTGAGKGRMGETRAGFELTGTLNRTDFGLVWNMLTETGSLIVGEEIKLQLDIELIKEQVAATAQAAGQVPEPLSLPR